MIRKTDIVAWKDPASGMLFARPLSQRAKDSLNKFRPNDEGIYIFSFSPKQFKVMARLQHGLTVKVSPKPPK